MIKIKCCQHSDLFHAFILPILVIFELLWHNALQVNEKRLFRSYSEDTCSINMTYIASIPSIVAYRFLDVINDLIAKVKLIFARSNAWFCFILNHTEERDMSPLHTQVHQLKSNAPPLTIIVSSIT